MTVLRVDARGMRCPWPALRAAKAMRMAQEVVLLADDPAASTELAALAAGSGWSMVRHGDEYALKRIKL